MKTNFLGIDIGSVAIGIALMDEHNRILHTDYTIHKGQIRKHLLRMLKGLDLSSIRTIGYTSSTPAIFKGGKSVDTRVSYITAAKHFHPDIRSLLIIGAEKFGLVTFDEHGEYRNYKSNSSCAAGTGNFLDQQSERLNLQSIEEFSKLAYENQGGFPKIASRCAVFAKTDLIHAQQEGYAVGEICDGLSYGLAKNIVDAVFQHDTSSNVVAAGGVALNKAVIDHIEKLTGRTITVDEHANVYGAIGAAINGREDDATIDMQLNSPEDILLPEKQEKKYDHPPLQLKLSDYPDFDSHERYEYRSDRFTAMTAVEVDAYLSQENKNLGEVYLGIDIGSTSTKAVMVDRNKEVLAGFYTRTSGQPLYAVQLIFETIDDFARRRNVDFTIAGSGTTGSGRKFTGKIIGADIMPDEITAHARAAWELDHDTDTIIEIGGQDSKFTILRNGMVTFSVMNNICAAGTGSFIEEQAKKLKCPLEDYADRVKNVWSPMASDRCTVFMERDLNYYLMAGYSADEILGAVLHSTRENYLTKVAVQGYIGDKIFFQGATAKNKALVAAFEQKLQKPIMVSKYCHLTGALGVALEICDQPVEKTNFRGLGLYKRSIPVRTEVCELCTNHCKLKVAEIDGQIEAYGFLCGRDYHSNKYVSNKPAGFELIPETKKLFRFKPETKNKRLTIGIPAGLHLYEELLFWRKFFDSFSIKTVTSEKYNTPVKDGKKMCGAEFCAPMAAMHGHVDYLKDKADYIFLPVYMQEPGDTKMKDQYCYYTQFSSSIISVQDQFNFKNKLLTPLLKTTHGELSMRIELFRVLKSIGLDDLEFLEVSRAYKKAKDHVQSVRKQWQEIYQRETENMEDIHVMLLGRPYTVLSPVMNSHIPEAIEKLGVKTFFMDMMPDNGGELSVAQELIKTIKWKFASRILHAAERAARTENCYPVLVTSFKCTPDSFVIEYFKEILDAYKKPYLILQLDEHDSMVGYETRIESAIRAFRNHQKRQKPKAKEVATVTSGGADSQASWQEQIKSLVHEASHSFKSSSIDFQSITNRIWQNKIDGHKLFHSIFSGANKLKDKTLLLPSWDDTVCPLLEAVMLNSGIKARLVSSTNDSVQRSLSMNTGQCLPLNIIVQNAIDYIRENGLDPAETALWLVQSPLSCNLSMFPYYTRTLLDQYGQGMEKAQVYLGEVVFYDISLPTAIESYLAFMFGGFVRKIGCSIRPYEIHKGETDRVIDKALALLYDTFRHGKSKEEALEQIIADFQAIETKKEERPKVAIFGDLFVRDNDLMNQHLIKTVEENGGEVITTPYNEYIKSFINPYTKRFFKEGRYWEYARHKFLKSLIPLVEEKYQKYLYPYNGHEVEISAKETDEWLNKFGLSIFHRGESLENILKIHKLTKQYPDIDLFIQTNPAYCCPSLVTEAMTSKIEEVTGVPVVTIEYDGTAGIKNEDIVPYLKYRKKR
ncbi:MAG: acyl-CoA dehydratase activase [Bacteroidales bacterium]|nr:acyl-CoA dehydratase activase [Bacteroidales bacterium]